MSATYAMQIRCKLFSVLYYIPYYGNYGRKLGNFGSTALVGMQYKTAAV